MHKKIELKATGETTTFLKTSADTKGDFVEAIFTMRKGEDGPPKHRHVRQTEYFEAVEGRLGLECDGDKMVLNPGESFTVPMGSTHTCYPAGEEDIRFKVVFSPALNIEYILTEIFESCNRKNSKAPSPFDATYVLKETKREYLLGGVPVLVQKIVFPALAEIGKLFGFVKARSLTEYLNSD